MSELNCQHEIYPNGLERLKYNIPINKYVMEIGYKYVFDTPDNTVAKLLLEESDVAISCMDENTKIVEFVEAKPNLIVHRMKHDFLIIKD